MQTVTVVPHMVRRNVDTGEEISIFSAYTPGNWETVNRGYTWEKTDRRGTITRGLGRHPVASIAEANQVANRVAKALPNTTAILMEVA